MSLTLELSNVRVFICQLKKLTVHKGAVNKTISAQVSQLSQEQHLDCFGPDWNRTLFVIVGNTCFLANGHYGKGQLI